MIHHLSVGVADFDASAGFYDAVLGALGYSRLVNRGRVAAWGRDRPVFWIGPPHDGRPAAPGNGVHVCFDAPSRDAVGAFHAAALAHGGGDAGAPGLRPQYEPDYYAAFATDPTGNKVEAVFFG